MPLLARRPFAARINDENLPPAESISKGGNNIKKFTPRTMTRPRSAPLFERAQAQAAAAETPAPPAPAKLVVREDEALSSEEVASAIKSVTEAFSRGNVELLPVFERYFGDSENTKALLRCTIGVKKNDYKNNQTKLMDHVKVLRSAMDQQLTRQKTALEVTLHLQDEIASHLRKTKEETAEQKSAYEAAAAESARQTSQSEVAFKQKLEMAEFIRQEIVSAAQRKEADMAQAAHGYQRELAQLMSRFEETRQQLASAREELSASQAHLAAKGEQVEKVTQEKDALKITFDNYKEQHGTTNEQQMQSIAELKIMVSTVNSTLEQTKKEVVVKTDGISQHQCEIQSLKQRLQDEERKRRDMHNMLQELKGNIRVFCRVRPLTDDTEVSLNVRDAANMVSLDHGGEHYDFSYDKLFGMTSTQQDIFDEVSCLVQSALDGYKVCIFAYGQTGSGKTFTMQGGNEPSSWGLIPRSLSQIFESTEDMRKRGWAWSLEATFVEVYNETIRDLLREDDGTLVAHTIVHDDMWGSIVSNVTSVDVDSMQQISSLMDLAAKQRAVGHTDMNSTSSRSHAVFALYLKGVNSELGIELSGALHLVDLAGSERLDKSGATGCRLKETQNINKSLSSLADVFLAKAEEGRSHIPFRNSKLTHLMEPCLSGHGKTLMMLNVGPEDTHAHETLCALRFAKQVSQCSTGKPKCARKVLPSGGSSAPASRSQTPSAGASARPQTPRSRMLRV